MPEYNYITQLGVIVPDTSVIKDQVESEWRAVLGNDLPVSPETPQGVMITAEVEARDSSARNSAELANQINPDIAGGVFLDAIWSFLSPAGGGRRPATRSTIPGAIFTGIPGVVIPAGSAATVKLTGDRFLTVAPITLDSSGSAVGDLQSENFGPVAAPSNSLEPSASGVLGWEGISNPSSAVLGALQESDESSRRRRRQTLALQGASTPEAIQSRVYAIDGVQSLVYRENVKTISQVIDGINLSPKSIYVCVFGGDTQLIAEALLASKSGGADWNGSVLVTVIEPASGQPYEVRFDRPTEVLIYVRVYHKINTLDTEKIAKDAIIAYANGESNGEPGFGTGEDISPFELSGAINQVEPRIFVTKVEVSRDGITYTTENIDMSVTEIGRVSSDSITVISV